MYYLPHVYVMSILSDVDFIKSTFDKIDITYTMLKGHCETRRLRVSNCCFILCGIRVSKCVAVR